MSVMALILSCRLGEFMRDRWRKLCVCTFVLLTCSFLGIGRECFIIKFRSFLMTIMSSTSMLLKRRHGSTETETT